MLISARTPFGHRLRIATLSGLALLLLLLSACSGTATQSPTPTSSVPTPVISPTLQKEGDAQLQTYQQWIALMQQYNGAVTTYQQQYSSDQQALQSAGSDAAYQKAMQTLNAQVAAIQIPAMKTESNYLFQELQQDAANFGKQHTYYDTYNNTTYQLGYAYGPNGATGPLWLQGELAAAKTMDDYQQAIEDLNMNLTNFQAMVTDSADKTPYNQVHQTDIQLMQHYGYMSSNVVVVSLAEQVLRVYSKGKLVNSFQVTTGQPDLPSPPGTWWVEGKKSPTVFKADVPPSSPNWYPPTPINFAMQFHSNGYFLHDSWWRTEYGPGTNFPHLDPGGTQYSIHGSHGCVNMSTANADWLYKFVQVYTHVLIY
ncbi:MAG TPA: L,D-transpeptidase [Ktedonobacteraceae bacterium]|nr:L,D-transpeptidase [Ktedonobacteraceae bacterium]